ncbi:AN1-type zinc finger protein 4 isoform X7 [Rhipicephalus sanguineus]|uniref:AN1-type zinc finger protein 4 isoform X7 n=1 Tax=Rhipicephalus sanguineus TaxID=34632 RepID=UPI0020C205D6|nr:AN1-type zinc finger protein 4 isoform X7 [Rhipicephalus sanguineus]
MASSDVIEVLIETLHGTAFELLVSPADTVVSIKSRISRLEGIPVSQQHLIWQSQELPDDSSLHECNITDGATIRLVLGMRGGPINTRKDRVLFVGRFITPYLEERPSLHDVAKYLDTRGEEVSLNVPRLRAVRLVVMRDGDKVHLYTVLDSVPRPPSGLLRCSEDNTPRELSDEDSASERSRHRENQVTRQKLEELQKKMRNLRLRKEGQPTFIGQTAPKFTKAPSKALLPPLKPLKPQPAARLDDDNAASAADTGPPTVVPRNSLPSSNVPVFGKKKALCMHGAAEKALGSGTVLPQLPTTSCGSRITPRHWRSPLSIQGSSHASHNLPSPLARAEATGAVPKRTERTTGAVHTRAGAGFQGRCRKVLLLATLGPVGSSSSRCASLPEEGGTACTAEPTRYYKVLPPVGRQEQACLPCLPPDCERQPGQDLAAAVASMLEPLELDWADCDRPRTAPARFVRVSVIHRTKTSRPIVSSPCTPDKGHACKVKAPSTGGIAEVAETSALPSSVPVKPLPLASGPLTPLPASPKPLRPLSPATPLEMPPADSDACRQELFDALKPPPPSDNNVPTSNGPPSGSTERSTGSSAEASGSTVTGASVATLPAESSASAVSASAGSMSADTASITASTSGSNVALSVDVGTGSSAELTVGNGAELMPVPVDDDSSSTSESKTDDMPVDPLHPSPGKAKKKGKRCSWCNKKTGLASTYVCRCGSTFCAAHRYAEAHGCSHDYKAEGRYILQRNNPVVKAAKLPKI